MNRKLHNSLLAFSVSGLLLAMGLLAAHPSAHPVAPLASIVVEAAETRPAVVATAPVLAVWSSADDALGRAAWADAVEAQPHARAGAVEAVIARDADFDGLLAGALALTVEASAKAAFAQALQASGADAAESARRRHERRLRSALAVPYFSFSQGLRRGAGS